MSRDGVRQALPPSKKTRALLGYLLLSGRSHRREALCSMFWDVADDPRGALRWSLSRLRPLLDAPGLERLQATRDAVALALHGAEVDALALRSAVVGAGDLARAETALLERWAGMFAGELLEGLDLHDFDEFQAFCLAQREDMRRLRVRVLAALGARFANSPERALPYLHSWTTLDVLNVAARTQLLEQLQRGGRSDEALQHFKAARRLFEEHASPELPALEHAWNEIRVLRVHAPAARPTEPDEEPSSRPTRPSLLLATTDDEVLGRAAELTWLREGLRGVMRERRPKLLFVSGEPGIGKSHLLRYFSDWATQKGLGVALGQAREDERERPFAALLDFLGEEAVETPPGAGQPRSPAELRETAANAIVRQARKQSALCLVIEDAHWLDRASAELLQRATLGREQVPLLIVVSARSDERADNPALNRLLRELKRAQRLEERTLSPLSSAALSALLAREGSELDSERVSFQAGGNPLFALELARLGDLSEERLPESITEAVRERLSRLTPEANEVLRWAAVLDARFAPRELAGLARSDEELLIAGLEQLEQRALLQRTAEQDHEPHYQFAHALVRRAVYGELSPPRRQWMHARIAQALHARGDQCAASLSQLMRHATLAHEHALAAEACVAAGTRCLRLFAYAEAAAVARRGLKHCERLDGLERVRRGIELLEIALWCAPRGQASELTQRIRALGDEAHAFGALAHARRAHKVLSYWHLQNEALGSSQHHTLMAELISRAAEPHEQLGSLAEAGRCMLLLGREHERALGMLAEAAKLAEQLHLEPAVLRDGQGLALRFDADLERAARRFEQAAALASVERNRLIEFQALEHRTLLEFERGDYDAAFRYAGPLIEAGRSLPSGSELPFAEAIRAMAMYALDPARERDVARWFSELRAQKAQRRLLHACAKLCELDLMHGALSRAVAHARETLALAQELERPNERYLALTVLAHAAGEAGQPEEALRARAALAECDERQVERGTLKRMRALAEQSAQPRRVRPAAG